MPRKQGFAVTAGLKDRHPVCFAFDDAPNPQAAPPSGDFETRIRSIWRFLARQVLSFQETLAPRERANFDAEDVLIEVYIDLKEKDDKWTPDRGRYITYAAEVAKHLMCSLRERARVVEAPRNAYSRLRDYERADEAGELSPDSARVADRIRSSIASQDTWSQESHTDPEASGSGVDKVIRDESIRIAKNALVSAVGDLAPFEAVILGEKWGLWGKPEQSERQIAAARGLTFSEVRSTAASAEAKIRDSLIGSRHVAASGG